jgi:hypothetical protein
MAQLETAIELSIHDVGKGNIITHRQDTARRVA